MEGNEVKLLGAEKEFLDAIEQKQKEQPELLYQDAVKLVGSENPDLVQRYRRATMSYQD
jgi:hypothetical protein